MNDRSRTADEFERAYTLDSSLLHAKYGKAFLYAIQQQPAEGLRYLKKIEQETPTVDGDMLYKVAQAYALLGDKPSAELVTRALDLHKSLRRYF